MEMENAERKLTFKKQVKAGETTEKVRTLPRKPEDLSSTPGTYIKSLRKSAAPVRQEAGTGECSLEYTGQQQSETLPL